MLGERVSLGLNLPAIPIDLAFFDSGKGRRQRSRLMRCGRMIQGCLLEAGLSRGDLTEARWCVLKDLVPIAPENRAEAGVPNRKPLDYQRHTLAASV